MTQNDDSLRQTALVARLEVLEMPIPAKAFMTATARPWYKSAVARGLSGRNAPQNVRYGYGPRIPRPTGAGVIGHHANNGKGR